MAFYKLSVEPEIFLKKSNQWSKISTRKNTVKEARVCLSGYKNFREYIRYKHVRLYDINYSPYLSGSP